jgi:hypothetical protein
MIRETAVQPPTVRPPGISDDIDWSPKSTGWDCRKVHRKEGKRRRLYLGHLTSRKLLAMPEADRPATVAAWVQEKKIAKGVN